MNYNNKRFRLITNSESGAITGQTIFHYQQEKNILSCTYFGEKILKGQLLGWVDEAGNIDMLYHQIDKNGQLMTGICKSKPEILPNGKIRLHENWQWTSGDQSSGYSIIEEMEA